jgi:hypothetical protein
MTSDQNELKKMILKQVATKINNATSGETKRRILPANVIDLARERARRRLGK